MNARMKQQLKDVNERLRKATALTESARADLGKITEAVSTPFHHQRFLEARSDLSDVIRSLRSARNIVYTARVDGGSGVPAGSVLEEK